MIKKILILVVALIASKNFLNALIPNELSYQANAKPGDEIHVKFNLVNERDASEKVEFKVRDLNFNAHGETFFEDPGTFARSNAKWIELANERCDIGSKGQMEVFYTIRVPKNPSLKGSYFSVILIEPTDPLPADNEPNEHQFQIKVKIRYAYHVVVNIGDGEANIKIVERNIFDKDNKKWLVVDVLNNGELFLKPKLNLKIFDQNGKLIQTSEEQQQRLYPTTSVRYQVDVTSLNPKDYTGFLLLDNGDSHLFGDRFEFQIK